MPTLNTAPLGGLPPEAYDSAYGGIPTVSDPNASANAAIWGNLGNLSSIFNLAGGINQFGAQQAAGQYEANLPGYDALNRQSSENILSDLAGTVSPDVMALLAQTAAERGGASGITGSPNSNAALLRALGLTSDALKARGQTELTGAIQRTPTSPLFNVASMLTTPDQQQAAQTYANLLAASPQPAAAAAAAIANAQKGLAAGQAATHSGTTVGQSQGLPGPIQQAARPAPSPAAAAPIQTYTGNPNAAPAAAPTPWQLPNIPGVMEAVPTNPLAQALAANPYAYDANYGAGAYQQDFQPAGAATTTNADVNQFISDYQDAYGGQSYPTPAEINQQFGAGTVDQYGYTPQDYYDAMFGDMP